MQSFPTLQGALDHIGGSAVDPHTRPWVRMANASALGSFLIVRGRKLRPDGPHPLPVLHADDAALLNAWLPEPSQPIL